MCWRSIFAFISIDFEKQTIRVYNEQQTSRTRANKLRPSIFLFEVCSNKSYKSTNFVPLLCGEQSIVFDISIHYMKSSFILKCRILICLIATRSEQKHEVRKICSPKFAKLRSLVALGGRGGGNDPSSPPPFLSYVRL